MLIWFGVIIVIYLLVFIELLCLTHFIKSQRKLNLYSQIIGVNLA